MKIKWLWCLLLTLILGGEALKEWWFFQEITPFPEVEYWYATINYVLRDLLLVGLGLLLYLRKGRIKDRTERYFPVVVVGVSYLAVAGFILWYLQLDLGFLTILSVFTGLFNNLVLVLIAAMCYYKWPTRVMKIFYFVLYLLTCLIMLFDAGYFWTTSMHVESVLFKNLNIYAMQGVLATTAWWQLAAVGVACVVAIALFRVPQPHKKKPNFTWSLLCAAMFGLALNLSYFSLAHLSYFAIDHTVGLDIVLDIEKTRQNYRKDVATPINVNFFNKALFDTDKIVKNPLNMKKRVLTSQDKTVLAQLGINPDKSFSAPVSGKYDKIVMLVLESVHRDYLHYYNNNIPAETTPFLDQLISKYPHMDRYYSSAIPTTQGLNSTFRSQLIFDADLAGVGQSSLYRSLQDAGWRGIFLNASSKYYNNEFREYVEQYGMNEYYAREYLEGQGYKGATGWGYHNDIIYKEALSLLLKGAADKMFLVAKTLDMHQPYPYYGYSWDEMPPTVRDSGVATICGMYWVDKTLEAFFKEAEATGLMDERTIFIITSDHNPHSGGEYKDLVANPQDKQSIAPIPLIFVAKNLEPLDDLRTHDYASQIDLAPTLLGLAGVAVPEDFLGRNLLERTEVPFALGYFGGKAYYYAEELSFVDQLDNPTPPTPEDDALANFIMWDYVKRHLGE